MSAESNRKRQKLGFGGDEKKGRLAPIAKIASESTRLVPLFRIVRNGIAPGSINGMMADQACRNRAAVVAAAAVGIAAAGRGL